MVINYNILIIVIGIWLIVKRICIMIERINGFDDEFLEASKEDKK